MWSDWPPPQLCWWAVLMTRVGLPAATAAGGSQVSTGGSTEVKVDGKDLSGLDLNR